MNWIKNNKANVALVFASIIVSLILVDVVLYNTRYKYPIYRLNYPPYYFVKDSELGYDIAKNFATATHFFRDDAFPIWSNNIGCFDTDYADEAPYIYLAGDSLTWSFAPFKDTWGKRIEDLVGIRTVKCGVVGYGTKAEFIKATRNFANFKNPPSLIIVGYTAYNDFNDDANFPQNVGRNGFIVRNQAVNGVSEEEAEIKYANFEKYCTFGEPSNKFISGLRCFITNHSVLFNIFKSDIRDKIDLLLPGLVRKLEGQGVLAKQTGSDVPETADEYQKHLNNILSFKKLAEEKGATLLLVLTPYDNSKVIPFLDKEKIPYIDLNPIFDKYKKTKPVIWPKDGHFNIAGNHLVGAIATKFIIENDLVKVDNKAERIQAIEADIRSEFGKVE